MAGQLYLGTSGFAFPEWKGSFYPADLKNKDMLAFYSTRLSSVEINFTFRRFPTVQLLESWRHQVGSGFRFTLKAHQRITHRKRLQDVDREIKDFTAVASSLQERLGPILFQCPPNLRYDRQLLEQFLAALPPGFLYAMEFRHDSFDVAETRELLAQHQVAWCVTDSGDGTALSRLHRTAPFVYIRMRDASIAEDELQEWARVVAGILPHYDAYVYFMHEGVGATEAVRFQELLTLLPT